MHRRCLAMSNMHAMTRWRLAPVLRATAARQLALQPRGIFFRDHAVQALSMDTKRVATPMIQQYLARKQEYPDCMLLFQVGDFYEFFGDDARRASHLLNLALTRKSKQRNELEEMCGFPLTSLDSYVEKLVMHHGVKVAICNQVESAASAKQRGFKALVNRQVVRIVTPGSLVEDTMLTPEENNYLAAVYRVQSPEDGSRGGDDAWGVAWADLSTGEFLSTTTTTDKLNSVLLRCSPREILLPQSFHSQDQTADGTSATGGDAIRQAVPETCMMTYRPDVSFLGNAHHVRLKRNVVPPVNGTLQDVEFAAAAAILDYVEFTQKNASTIIKAPLHMESSDHMIIDSSAWKSLEIAKSLNGSKTSSLLNAIDSTITAPGSRLLASHLASPLLDVEVLQERLDAVAYFHAQEFLLKRARKQLNDVFDIERSIQRLSVGLGTPKDLKNIATTIDEASKLVRLLLEVEGQAKHSHSAPRMLPRLLQSCCDTLQLNTSDEGEIQRVATEIHAALKDDFAALNSRSGFVQQGYSHELDRWRRVLRASHHDATPAGENGEQAMTQREHLQAKYREMLMSTRLRVIHQPEKGFFIEIPNEEHRKLVQSDRLPEEMVLFQSLKNSVRYRTDEIKVLNREMMEASYEVMRLESEIFERLKAQVVSVLSALQAMAQAIAQIDVVCSHAQVALDQSFTRPLLDTTLELHVEDGRHAVVEAAHLRGKNSRAMRAFVPNSLHLGAPSGACWLLTGPNMGGKSTFLRQSAHIVVLAQIGSYVPAKFARVGLVDKLFSRVGSADDLASDKSTFMVEMEETSTILTQATSRSLVLMDEVGRGTSVNDGIAIAGAVLESLCEKKTRTLFATHFTVLSQLLAPQYQDQLQLYRMEVLERPHPTQLATTQLVFSHRVVEGLAQQSYGINTAALAGCPRNVTNRAEELLAELTLKSSPSRLPHSGASADATLQEIRQLFGNNSSTQDPPSVAQLLRRIQELIS